MSDRLALAHVIEDAGIPRDKAENLATAISRFVEGSSATKADVTAVRTEVQASEARLNARIDLVEHRLLTRLGGLIVVVGGILFAALHLWPPHAG
jgi:hypothetical protein